MHKHDIKDVDEDLRPKGGFWTSEHVLTACPDLSSPRRGDSFNIFACCMNISSAIQNARGAWMDMRKEGGRDAKLRPSLEWISAGWRIAITCSELEIRKGSPSDNIVKIERGQS